MARSLQQDGKTVAPATAAQLLAGVNMNPVVEKEKDDEEVLVPGSEKYNLKEKRAEDLRRKRQPSLYLDSLRAHSIAHAP